MKKTLLSKLYQKEIYKRRSILDLELEYNENFGTKIHTDLVQKPLSKEEISQMNLLREKRMRKKNDWNRRNNI